MLQYDLPDDVIATTETIDDINSDTSHQLQTQNDDITDQTCLGDRLSSMDATTAAGVRMQENTAYQPSTTFTLNFGPNPTYENIEIAPGIATKRNVAYEHTTAIMTTGPNRNSEDPIHQAGLEYQHTI